MKIVPMEHVQLDNCVVKTTSKTYRKTTYEGKQVRAHRLVFFLHNGYWPTICRHTCDNAPCENPNHLIDGTYQDNVDDMIRRGRGFWQNEPGQRAKPVEESRKTNRTRMRENKNKCIRGHLFSSKGLEGKTRKCMEPECRDARRYNAVGGQ